MTMQNKYITNVQCNISGLLLSGNHNGVFYLITDVHSNILTDNMYRSAI